MQAQDGGGCGVIQMCMLLMRHQIIQPLWKPVWQFLMKLNMHLMCDPEIAFAGLYQRETGWFSYTKSSLWMLKVLARAETSKYLLWVVEWQKWRNGVKSVWTGKSVSGKQPKSGRRWHKGTNESHAVSFICNLSFWYKAAYHRHALDKGWGGRLI